MVADLSPHNPGSRRFLDSIGPKAWDEMNNPDDCSVARGIGLAIADSGFLHGLSVQTVRTSERSAGERGDNLVLFSAAGTVPQIFIDEAYYYAGSGARKSSRSLFPDPGFAILKFGPNLPFPTLSLHACRRSFAGCGYTALRQDHARNAGAISGAKP